MELGSSWSSSPILAFVNSGSYNSGNLNSVSLRTSEILNVPSNGVLITSIKELAPTGELVDSVLLGSK